MQASVMIHDTLSIDRGRRFTLEPVARTAPIEINFDTANHAAQ